MWMSSGVLYFAVLQFPLKCLHFKWGPSVTIMFKVFSFCKFKNLCVSEIILKYMGESIQTTHGKRSEPENESLANVISTVK